MKKTAIIGIVIAIIVAGGLGIYAVSNTEGPLGDEVTVGFDEEATVTVEEDLGEQSDEFGFGDEASTTVEEDSGEEDEAGASVDEDSDQKDSVGFGDSASVTVENP